MAAGEAKQDTKQPRVSPQQPILFTRDFSWSSDLNYSWKTGTKTEAWRVDRPEKYRTFLQKN